jgi:hypothetical protein
MTGAPTTFATRGSSAGVARRLTDGPGLGYAIRAGMHVLSQHRTTRPNDDWSGRSYAHIGTYALRRSSHSIGVEGARRAYGPVAVAVDHAATTGHRSSSRPGDQPKTPVPRDQHVRRTFVGGLLGRTTLAPSRASRGLCVRFGQRRLVIGEGALERLLDAWSDRPKTTRIVAAGAPHSIDAADRRHRFDARAAQVTEIGTD